MSEGSRCWPSWKPWSDVYRKWVWSSSAAFETIVKISFKYSSTDSKVSSRWLCTESMSRTTSAVSGDCWRISHCLASMLACDALKLGVRGADEPAKAPRCFGAGVNGPWQDGVANTASHGTRGIFPSCDATKDRVWLKKTSGR